MAEIVKVQSKCYFITPEHASSFWGKYIYLYSGQGRLQLTSKSLVFESKTLSFDIPFQAIKNVSVGVFSKWAKPFGLINISLHFFENEKEKIITLMPVESAFSPTWKTSKIVNDWAVEFSQIGELSTRMEMPIPQIPAPTTMQIALFFLLLFTFNLAAVFTTIQIIKFFQ